MAKNLALSFRKWHKKNLIGENGGERKINPSANPEDASPQNLYITVKNTGIKLLQAVTEFDNFQGIFIVRRITVCAGAILKEFEKKCSLK